MQKTRLSLYYVAGYLFPTGILLFLAPQLALKLLFANHEYSDAFVQFSGVMLIALGIVVLAVIRQGNPMLYRTTLLLRAQIWLCTFILYWKTGETLFVVVLAVVGLGMVVTGSLYLTEARTPNS